MIHGVQNCKIPAPEHRGFRILDCQRSITTLNSESPPDPWHIILPVLGSLRPNRLLAQGRTLDGLLQEGENSQQDKADRIAEPEGRSGDGRVEAAGGPVWGRQKARVKVGPQRVPGAPSSSCSGPRSLEPGAPRRGRGARRGGGLGTSSGPREGEVRLIRGPSTVPGIGRPPERAPKAAAAPGELPTSPSGGRRAQPAQVGTLTHGRGAAAARQPPTPAARGRSASGGGREPQAEPLWLVLRLGRWTWARVSGPAGYATPTTGTRGWWLLVATPCNRRPTQVTRASSLWLGPGRCQA